MGHGKTVLLKTICGYMFLSSGDVFQDGVKIRNKNNYIQDAGILIENLKLLKEMSSKITDEEIEKWIEFYNIEEFRNTKYKNLSLGTKQKLALIQAFIHKPKVLILDEPFNALDKESLKETEEYLASIKKDIILILSTHINDNVKYICDYEYIFEDKNLKMK